MAAASPHGARAHLAGLEEAVSSRLEELEREDVPRRIWRGDHTVWRDDPTEIADRLGWLRVHREMAGHVADLEEFAAAAAADGLRHVVLAGMGGSSLAPEVLRSVFGVAKGRLDLAVLDSTHPDQIRAVEASVDLERTLFVIASKSGTTVETLSHLDYFWERVPDGSRFVAVTDPGSALQDLAGQRGFRRTFANPQDIGGRFSALSYFGLVPAALIGADIGGMLARADAMAEACDAPAARNPGAWLGAVMGEAALAGRDKLTLVLPEPLRAFGFWIEQLIAESTGKEGRGILPVEGEDLGPSEVYGRDRLFVGVGGDELRAGLEPLEHAGHPAVLLPLASPVDLGAEFFRWEFATAVAGRVIGIHPFDQPNVQEAKDATTRVLDQGGAVEDPGQQDAGPVLDDLRPGDYAAIQAFLPRTAQNERRLQAARLRIRDRHRVATTVGFGPRFLHSTGQLHKGGPDTGVFLQVVEDVQEEDLAIPGRPYGFGGLLAAQALGDYLALRSRGRRVVRLGPGALDDLG